MSSLLCRVNTFHVSILSSFFMPCHRYFYPSDISVALIQSFLTIYVFNKDEVVSLMPQPPTWRTKVSFLVWPITFDSSNMGGPTGNICYRRHGSEVHLGTQAPPLRQSRDTSGGANRIGLDLFLTKFGKPFI
jgi:hypothetical protein